MLYFLRFFCFVLFSLQCLAASSTKFDSTYYYVLYKGIDKDNNLKFRRYFWVHEELTYQLAFKQGSNWFEKAPHTEGQEGSLCLIPLPSASQGNVDGLEKVIDIPTEKIETISIDNKERKKTFKKLAAMEKYRNYLSGTHCLNDTSKTFFLGNEGAQRLLYDNRISFNSYVRPSPFKKFVLDTGPMNALLRDEYSSIYYYSPTDSSKEAPFFYNAYIGKVTRVWLKEMGMPIPDEGGVLDFSLQCKEKNKKKVKNNPKNPAAAGWSYYTLEDKEPQKHLMWDSPPFAEGKTPPPPSISTQDKKRNATTASAPSFEGGDTSSTSNPLSYLFLIGTSISAYIVNRVKHQDPQKNEKVKSQEKSQEKKLAKSKKQEKPEKQEKKNKTAPSTT